MASKPIAHTMSPSTTALITMMTSTSSIVWTTTRRTTTILTPDPQSLTTVSTFRSTKPTKSINHSAILKSRTGWRSKIQNGTSTASTLVHTTTSTQPTNLVKNEPQTSENSVQKVQDYNSILDDEKNESAIDMMLRKSTTRTTTITTTTQQTTTPEPRNYNSNWIHNTHGERRFYARNKIIFIRNFRFLHCVTFTTN